MKKMILALVAVLVLTGVTSADVKLNVAATDGFATEGFQSWTLTAVDEIVGFANVRIDGTVVQANKFEVVWDEGLGEEVEQITDTIFKPSTAAAVLQYDTHLMFAKPTVGIYNALTETNDKSLNTQLGGPKYSYNFGLGTFYMDGGFDISTAPIAAGAAFMQIVLPENTQVTLSYTMPVNGADTTFSQVVGVVPEPSTVLLLVAGFACLLVARFRK